jgi:hypothetical protein
MNKLRQRKMEARAGRLEALRNRDKPTIEKTIVHVPQPKNLVKKENVKVELKSKSPKVAVEVKRGPGRPRKETTENINKSKKVMAGKKILASTKGKK